MTGLKECVESSSPNLAPGIGTEVIALFDLDLLAKGRAGVRSVHVFTERRKQANPSSLSPPSRSTPAAAPVIVGALAVLMVIFGIVAVAREARPRASAAPRSARG